MADMGASGGESRYKIGDVCRIADVQPYVLRYWESEFPVLAPDKSQPGPRTYSSKELKLIEQIKRLLYDEGYTIAGAKKRLEAEGGPKTQRDTSADTNPAVAPLSMKVEREEKEAPKKEEPKKADRVERGMEKPSPKVAEKPAERPAEKPQPARARVPEARTQAVEAFELPAPELSPVPAKASAAPVRDGRIDRAVKELKDVLALLSRAEP